ncbi:uncharacterized protein LOC134453583 [Engraulis encrasicolus]|uniref:uncharacterized protein LOC134453583 n=1 Tax=Engraulis encrasicolus TaxID=184585 RepID=UPI002FD6B4CA
MQLDAMSDDVRRSARKRRPPKHLIDENFVGSVGPQPTKRKMASLSEDKNAMQLDATSDNAQCLAKKTQLSERLSDKCPVSSVEPQTTKRKMTPPSKGENTTQLDVMSDIVQHLPTERQPSMHLSDECSGSIGEPQPTKRKMEQVFNLMEKHGLEQFYRPFKGLGVKDEGDFNIKISEENLRDIGLSQVDRKRLESLKTEIQRLGIVGAPTITRSLTSFSLKYSFPKCPEARELLGMDPKNTVEDVMLRIRHEENLSRNMSVCLFTADGMPLSEDPYFNTWSLEHRHIENGSELYAIFTPKENLRQPPKLPNLPAVYDTYNNVVRCHIMMKGKFDIRVDLESDTVLDVKTRLAAESGIPSHVLQLRDMFWDISQTLKDLDITEESELEFYLSSFGEEYPSYNEFFTNDVTPSVPQTLKGMSVFYATLKAMAWTKTEQPKNVVRYIRKLTGCHPLAQSLYQLICEKEVGTRLQKIAVVEGLYFLFRELLSQLSKEQIIEDNEVFEESAVCWAFLSTEGKDEDSQHEDFEWVSLHCGEARDRFMEPVRIGENPRVFEKSYILQRFRDDDALPNCTLQSMAETAHKRATDIEKILFSTPLWMRGIQKWTAKGCVSCSSFSVKTEKTLAKVKEEMTSYPHLQVSPPLTLKEVGVQGPLLVYLDNDNLGVYESKDKCSPQKVYIFNCLSGKVENVDLNELSNKLGDVRTDKALRTSRTPHEAIMVVMDASGSMSEKCCYSDISMDKMTAVKQLFNSFADRSMAYNFHSVISLLRIGGNPKYEESVQVIHTFTENLPTFQQCVDKLHAAGFTPLYDALQLSVEELDKVKKQFPNCRLRVLCLSDGDDNGSSKAPAYVANRLMNSNIVVDSINVGTSGNRILKAISHATGGCCFKPTTSAEALKLFEMETLLSLESRKLRPKPSLPLRCKEALLALSKSAAYDKEPTVNLPEKIKNKVTMTKNALKKKIQESRNGRFLNKDKRIVEELKNLHCDPHPYCSVFPSETDISFWKMLLQGPPDTPYEAGVFELYCEFGPEYPIKPPLLRFVTPVYHCNVNSIGRICHNIFDRNYSAHITMREIVDAVYGLLITPEPDDPLDSVLAELYLSDHAKYNNEAKKHTKRHASKTVDDSEKEMVGPELSADKVPPSIMCPLTKKVFVEPIITKEGMVYERKAIEEHLKKSNKDPITNNPLKRTDLKVDKDMKKRVTEYRKLQISI